MRQSLAARFAPGWRWLVVALLAGCSGPRIVLVRGPEGSGRDVFEVRGLDGEYLQSPQAQALSWNDIFRVYAEPSGAAAVERPPVLGSARVEGLVLRFEPRFPVEPGLTYRAVLDAGPWTGKAAAESGGIVASFPIAERKVVPRTVVAAVYPTSSTLPENQLKFYLCFSGPMRRGEAYSRIRLVEVGGAEVAAPFLELGEELWDPSGTRFTLFFDPGRIKRGILPHQEVGPCLVAGKTYALVVDADWHDARGAPLASGHRKEFFVSGPDYDSPEPSAWEIRPPRPRSRDPLRIELPEPLDFALLKRLVTVRNPSGEIEPGEVTVEGGELRWSFTPESSWQPGTYHLVVEKSLEDLAGNSVGRPFEVDTARSVHSRVHPETVDVPFVVP